MMSFLKLFLFSLFFIFSPLIQAGQFTVIGKTYLGGTYYRYLGNKATLGIKIDGVLQADLDISKPELNSVSISQPHSYFFTGDKANVSIQETYSDSVFHWIYPFAEQYITNGTTIYVCQGENADNRPTKEILYYHWGNATTSKTEWDSWTDVKCGKGDNPNETMHHSDSGWRFSDADHH